jgi:hypothetical protein
MARMASSVGRRVRGPILPAVDAVALVVFTVVGVANHDGGLPPEALARVGVPLLGCWFVAAAVCSTYRSPGLRTLLLAWATSVPVAGLVRTVLAGGPWNADVLAFLAVAMAFTLLFLLAGRAVARVVD